MLIFAEFLCLFVSMLFLVCFRYFFEMSPILFINKTDIHPNISSKSTTCIHHIWSKGKIEIINRFSFVNKCQSFGDRKVTIFYLYWYHSYNYQTIDKNKDPKGIWKIIYKEIITCLLNQSRNRNIDYIDIGICMFESKNIYEVISTILRILNIQKPKWIAPIFY